jgi:HK97 gp10 family phage protein
MRLHATAIFRPRSDAGRFVEVKVSPAVKAAVVASCKLIENAAKAMCPVDTGTLQDSISTTIDDSGKTIIGRVGPHTDYAAYVEFGTGIAGAGSPGAGEGPYNTSWPGMPAQPYMRPALDENRQAVYDVFGKEVGLAFSK